jgi:ABC-type transporter Mla maintaining outer membrane lipid asymmetry ATPase subunit MlaF
MQGGLFGGEGSGYSATDLVFENLLHELNSSGAVVVDYVLKLMGIDGCQDTVVGDAMLRGVSGGQKKRVTTAEMLVGFTQLLLMDEISTGLDSATTFQVALFITNYTHAMSCTTVVGLLQPPPETVALFDDILIIADGCVSDARCLSPDNLHMCTAHFPGCPTLLVTTHKSLSLHAASVHFLRPSTVAPSLSRILPSSPENLL